MICPSCGKELEDDAQFCVYCGKKILAQDKNANVQQENIQQNNSGAQNSANYSPFNSKQKQTQGANSFGKNSQSASGFANQVQEGYDFGNQAQASSGGTVTLQQNPKKKMMIIIIAVLIAVFAFLLAAFLFTSPKARASRQLKLGEQYLKDQKYEDAIAAFNASIKIDNKNIKPYEGLVSAYEAQNDYQNAADSMEIAITNIGLENIPDHDITGLVASYTTIASTAESSGDIEKAKKCYDRILELDPNNETVQQRLTEFSNVNSKSEGMEKNNQITINTKFDKLTDNDITTVSGDKIKVDFTEAEVDSDYPCAQLNIIVNGNSNLTMLDDEWFTNYSYGLQLESGYFIYSFLSGMDDISGLEIFSVTGNSVKQINIPDELQSVWQNQDLSDPNSFRLYTFIDILGTTSIYKNYYIGSDGIPVAKTEQYYYDLEYSASDQLTTKVKINVQKVKDEADYSEGTNVQLNVGIKLTPITIQNNNVIVKDDFGNFYKITYDMNSNCTINGLSQDDIFDGIMYAG